MSRVAIVEQITRDLLATLEGVTQSAGFDNTLTASRPDKLVGISPVNGTALLFQVDPERNEDPAQQHSSWLQPYSVQLFVEVSESSTTPIDQLINSIRSDVELAVTQDVTRHGLAVDTVIEGPALFDVDAGAFSGIEVRFTVMYMTLLNNPYQQ